MSGLKKATKKIKQIVASVAAEAVLESVRGFLDGLLEKVTPEHLYEAIKQDADPWNWVPKKAKSRGLRLAAKTKKYKDRVTVELVLDWLKEDRPDLASLIINMDKEGIRWLAKFVETNKNRLWG